MSVWCKWVIIGFSLGKIVFADPIQFDLVNKVMQDIVNEATKYDEVIDYVAPKFDEKYSDLQVGRLRYTLKGALKNTPWKPGHKSQVFAASTLAVRNHPRQRGISALSQAQFQTDSLALIRLAAKEALKRPLASFFTGRLFARLNPMSTIQPPVSNVIMYPWGRSVLI